MNLEKYNWPPQPRREYHRPPKRPKSYEGDDFDRFVRETREYEKKTQKSGEVWKKQLDERYRLIEWRSDLILPPAKIA